MLRSLLVRLGRLGEAGLRFSGECMGYLAFARAARGGALGVVLWASHSSRSDTLYAHREEGPFPRRQNGGLSARDFCRFLRRHWALTPRKRAACAVVKKLTGGETTDSTGTVDSMRCRRWLTARNSIRRSGHLAAAHCRSACGSPCLRLDCDGLNPSSPHHRIQSTL